MQLKISKPYMAAIIGVLIPVIVAVTFTISNKTVDAQEVTDTTVDVHVYKKIDGDPHGYELSDFAFSVTGGAINETLSHDEVIALPPGTYAVEELVPDGFIKSEWRVGWYGVGCDANDDDQYKGWITIDESDLGRFESPLPCEVNNQYRPNSDNGGGDAGNGVLVVNKIVVGTTTLPSGFSFSVDGGASVSFEADGSNSLSLAAGSYDVVEVDIPTGYTTSYDNCSSIALTANSTSTCTITNTYSNGGNGGGNGTSTLEYKLEGYVWHDADQNGAWPDTESALEGWTVTAINGDITLSTTTDATGYYYFVVEAGTWTLSEVLKEEWTQSFPSSPQTYVVTVPNGSVEEVTLWFPFNLFIKVAQAAIVETYSGFNFGNYYTGNGGGTGGDGDGNGGGDSDGGGGSSGGSSGRATPKVLGEQLTLPIGAPNMGAGGASSRLPISLAWLWPVLAWFGI